ncbi:hypothetical protein [Streptomyces sp. YU58]|uniref:hypothetical protein n=1 Tax=Streptomyces sp. SX92 TaxID=3158972 RepID=UPI0027B910D0|nr:hypothetical protein [Streptomyces coralus]WLW50325.1 hypothetical protein QU709_02665 [Streptomyces coralus]
MNDATERLLRDVVSRLQRSITERDCPAMVGLQGDRTLVLADYGYLPYTRRPNGQPLFDDHTVFTVPVQPYERYPGLHLLRAMTQDLDEPGEA